MHVLSQGLILMVVLSGANLYTCIQVHTVHQTWFVFVASNAYLAGNCVSNSVWNRCHALVGNILAPLERGWRFGWFVIVFVTVENNMRCSTGTRSSALLILWLAKLSGANWSSCARNVHWLVHLASSFVTNEGLVRNPLDICNPGGDGRGNNPRYAKM